MSPQAAMENPNSFFRVLNPEARSYTHGWHAGMSTVHLKGAGGLLLQLSTINPTWLLIPRKLSHNIELEDKWAGGTLWDHLI